MAKSTTCRHCGKTDLWWLPRRRDDYRLMNPDGSFHVCYPPTGPDEFEVCAESAPQPVDSPTLSP